MFIYMVFMSNFWGELCDCICGGGIIGFCRRLKIFIFNFLEGIWLSVCKEKQGGRAGPVLS